MYSREELKNLKRDFWNGFDEYTSTLKEFRNRRKKFILYNTKVRGAELKFDANRDGAFVILEFNQKNRNEQKEIFEHFKQRKVIINQYISDNLIWDDNFIRESGEQVCRIYLQKNGIDLHRKNDWPEFYKFMAEKMLQLEEAFLDIKDSLPE